MCKARFYLNQSTYIFGDYYCEYSFMERAFALPFIEEYLKSHPGNLYEIVDE